LRDAVFKTKILGVVPAVYYVNGFTWNDWQNIYQLAHKEVENYLPTDEPSAKVMQRLGLGVVFSVKSR
jgi:hypothetical protein